MTRRTLVRAALTSLEATPASSSLKTDIDDDEFVAAKDVDVFASTLDRQIYTRLKRDVGDTAWILPIKT